MGLVAFLSAKLSRPGKPRPIDGTIYDFKIKDLEGNEIDFSRYKNKNLLIVNTASNCAYTPQYADLENLNMKYGNFVTVLGFPANNFLWQEPGSNKEIASFCKKNYNVNFQMFNKVSVKGAYQHPLYRWLEAKTGKLPTWNFCKYLVSKDGGEIKFYSSRVSPLDAGIINEILK
jgi:glutathione peroxidase